MGWGPKAAPGGGPEERAGQALDLAAMLQAWGGGRSVGELGLRERLPETPSIQSPSEPSLVQPIPWMLQRTAEAQDRTDPGTLTAGRACPYGLAPYISVSGIPWTGRRSWPQRQPGKWVLASPTQVGL